MYDYQEELDNLVWDRNDEETEKATKWLRLTLNCDKVQKLVEEKSGKSTSFVSPLISGGFNILYRIHIEGVSPDVMVRVPIPPLVPFANEKTLQEAATQAFLAKNTKLPIPHPLFYDKDSIIGPYMIMNRVENIGSVSKRLTRPNEDTSAPHVLDPNVSQSLLETIWGQIARYMLQLFQPTFPRIGALLEVEGSYTVAGRPISHNMSDMVRLANIPRHNDAVTSEGDCRNKYVARQIFRRLAKQGRLSVFGFADDNWSAQTSKIPSSSLSPAPPNTHSFRLWGDDFRAGNMLLGESDKIAALIDWEYTYAAPTQFVLDPPWWLLIETAEVWSPSVDDWVKTYEARLKTWLSLMEKAEADTTKSIGLPAPLSRYMRESWTTGRWFLSYGARKSWAFDLMYWKFLDERFFGDREDGVAQDDLWKTRVYLLTEEEWAAMEPFVEQKMKESTDRRIVDWDLDEAKRRFAELLFD